MDKYLTIKNNNNRLSPGRQMESTMKTYLLKINSELWRKVKILAATKEITIRQLIANLLEKEINNGR